MLLDSPGKSVSQSLQDSISEVLAQNAEVWKQVRDVELQLEAQYGEVVRVPSPVEDLAEQRPLLEKVLGLVVNTMFYLSAEPEDVVSDWGRDTPGEVVDALDKASKPGEIKTFENTLRKAGYSKVNFVGRTFERSTASGYIQEAAETGRLVATHFRRGHFRRQAYGPERTLRKTIFVAPVLVNPGRDMEPQGRIYAVK